MTEEELEGKIVVGKLVERKRAEFGDGLQRAESPSAERASSERLGGGLRQDTSALETGAA